jgi:hypothetical protein
MIFFGIYISGKASRLSPGNANSPRLERIGHAAGSVCSRSSVRIKPFQPHKKSPRHSDSR